MGLNSVKQMVGQWKRCAVRWDRKAVGVDGDESAGDRPSAFLFLLDSKTRSLV